LASLSYTYIKTPDFDDIAFSLKANFDTTAGHSSNQVSTVLGLGVFLSFYSIFKNLKYSGNRIFDFIILGGFMIQGLLSFSRGGMVVGVLASILLVIISSKNKFQKSNISMSFTVVILLFLYGAFELANSITGGNLLLRYKGETQGTLVGSKEKTLDNLVTGRLSIFEGDIELWRNHFLLGVGVGDSKNTRNVMRGEPPHVELSRLLSEHGFLGLIFSIIWLTLPITIWLEYRNLDSRVILTILLVIAILSTFHAAMRTFVTPLFMILGSLKIIDSKINTNKLNVKTT
jgi:hypothetical protein